jgi:hypothetical protein
MIDDDARGSEKGCDSRIVVEPRMRKKFHKN